MVQYTVVMKIKRNVAIDYGRSWENHIVKSEWRTHEPRRNTFI